MKRHEKWQRWRERERKTERDTDRQTDREREREIDTAREKKSCIIQVQRSNEAIREG